MSIIEKHVSVHSTSFLRNAASHTGGAISISNGNDVIINNITCVGNQGGGCLIINYVTLTLNYSDISENIGGGVNAGNSRIQVGAKLTNETRLFSLNANFYCKFINVAASFIPSIIIFSAKKDGFIFFVLMLFPAN